MGEESQSQSERHGAEREKERGEQGRRESGEIKRQISEGRATETGGRQINSGKEGQRHNQRRQRGGGKKTG